MVDVKVLKESSKREVDAQRTRLTKIAKWMYENPELGSEEYKVYKLLIEELEKQGFNVEKELLGILSQNPGQCLSRDYLLRTIWGYEPGVRTRTLDVHIQRLRRKMQIAGVSGEIQTILRSGYCWQSPALAAEQRSVA